MSVSQSEKAAKFDALYAGPGAFVIANVFDTELARIVLGHGFEAVATSSGGFVGSSGCPGGLISHWQGDGRIPCAVIPIWTIRFAGCRRMKRGAKVLIAPGLPDLDAVRTLCEAVSKPFNFMVDLSGKSFAFVDLWEAGVRPASLATAVYRVAISAMIDAAKEVRDEGTFGFVNSSIPTSELSVFLKS
jgi:2-methylisocitrate lyase-like PEP mutase family enzyme